MITRASPMLCDKYHRRPRARSGILQTTKAAAVFGE
jgi:hypothetical protein